MTGRGVSAVLRARLLFVVRRVRSPVGSGYPWPVASQQSRRPFDRKIFVLRHGGGFVVGGEDGWLGFVLRVVTPVGLEEDGVDLFEIDGLGAVADGFDEGADAEVFDGSEGAFGGADDEVQRRLGEGVVGKADVVELAVDVVGDGRRGELFEFGGVGDAGADVVVDGELEGGVEGGLGDEDEVVVLGEVLQQEAELAQSLDGEEVGVVDDGDDEFAFGVEVFGFMDEAGFAFVVGAVGFEGEGVAEETEDVVPGMERAVDDGGDPLLGVLPGEGVLEDGLAGAGFAEDEAESALLGVDLEDVEVALLVFEEGLVFFDGEGIFTKSVVGSDHGDGNGWMFQRLGRRSLAVASSGMTGPRRMSSR
jgi:hypothetical protein